MGSGWSLVRLASSPDRSVLLSIIRSTLYRDMSKFVTALTPRNLIAATSYASAASSWVPEIYISLRVNDSYLTMLYYVSG